MRRFEQYVYIVVKYLDLQIIRPFIHLLSGTFCAPVAVEPTDEHKHLGLEPKTLYYIRHRSVEKNRKRQTKRRKLREKGGMGHLLHFRCDLSVLISHAVFFFFFDYRTFSGQADQGGLGVSLRAKLCVCVCSDAVPGYISSVHIELRQGRLFPVITIPYECLSALCAAKRNFYFLTVFIFSRKQI